MFSCIYQQKNSASACMPSTFVGSYEYGGDKLPANGGANGNFQECVSKTVMTLALDSNCDSGFCSFDGQWAGKGTAKAQFYLLSYLYERKYRINICFIFLYCNFFLFILFFLYLILFYYIMLYLIL